MIQPPLRRDLQPVAGARNHSLARLGAIALLATNACGTKTEPTEPTVTVEPLFKEAFRGTNGRSCATCHVPEDNFTLTPDHVARLLETNPNDPLFAAIDADDPAAETLTFEHLEKGLVRVWLPLPDNMDVIDDAGNVTTPPDRKIFVWRGVPSIADSALTAPYQLDGRVETLEEQAQGALTGHSGGGKANKTELERIAEFERSVFSSDRAREVADELASGVDFGEISDVEALMELSPEEERGREVYEKVCASCHGGANKATIADRAVHDLAFPALKPDGNVLFEVPATDPPTPVLATQPDNEFINIGSAKPVQTLFDALLGERFEQVVGDAEVIRIERVGIERGSEHQQWRPGQRCQLARDLQSLVSAAGEPNVEKHDIERETPVAEQDLPRFLRGRDGARDLGQAGALQQFDQVVSRCPLARARQLVGIEWPHATPSARL